MKQPKLELTVTEPDEYQWCIDIFEDRSFNQPTVWISEGRTEQEAWRMAEKRLRALANYAGKQADKLGRKK